MGALRRPIIFCGTCTEFDEFRPAWAYACCSDALCEARDAEPANGVDAGDMPVLQAPTYRVRYWRAFFQTPKGAPKELSWALQHHRLV